MMRLHQLSLIVGIWLVSACSSDATSTPSAAAGSSGSPEDNGAAGAIDDGNGVAGAPDDDDDIPPGSCIPDDQDGVVGGNNTVKLYITDTSFNVGTADSGQRNIAVQNSANVTLTITNAGSKPHGFSIACRPTDLPAMCNMPTSCFPTGANVAAIDPGDSVSVEFKTPVVEGEYRFTSDEPGDDALVGEFVLM